MGAGASALGDTMKNAIDRGDTATVLELIRSHPQLIDSPIKSDGSTALIDAANNGKKDIIDILIAAGADLNKQTQNGNTALLLTETKSLSAAFLEVGTDYVKQTEWGYTALMLAADKGHKDCVSILLVAGADKDKQTERGYTALILAASNGHKDCMTLLLDEEADTDKQNKDGNTALILAARSGQKDCVSQLLKAGADNDKQNNRGYTALILAAEKGHKDCVSLLLEAEADKDKQNNTGNTALMTAADKGHKDCLSALLEAGVDKDKQNKDGNTALMMAANNGNKDFVSLLLEAEADKDKQNKLNMTAIMIAAKRGHEEVLATLLESPNGRRINDKERACCIGVPAILKSQRCVSLMLVDFNPFKVELGQEVVAGNGGDGCVGSGSEGDVIGVDAAVFWTQILSSNDTQGICESEVCNVLDKHIGRLSDLMNVRDPTGRRAIDVATPVYKKAMEDRQLFLKRYKLNEGPAEHTSATCTVKLARDCVDDGKWVALKFMKHKDQFQRELASRENGNFSDDFVMSIMISYDGDENQDFRLETEKKGLYRYCVVMKAAERNFGTVLAHEHIAGRDWLQIRSITEQLAKALDHMHSKGFIHGDIKPLNIMRINGTFKLIDLDATVNCAKGEYVSAKHSSAYLPPEMIAILDNSTAVIRSCNTDLSTGKAVTTNNGLPYELVLASAAHDMWSLGVTLFQMYAGEPLFLMDDEGNMSQQGLHTLYNWTNAFKSDRLSRIKNAQARNLISRLLSKNPKTRPDAAHVLAHPFVAGKQTARMIGEKAEYDVFISYRVASDKGHAESLYTRLTGLGLKVWWDNKCLAPGVPWEEGFCDGLVNSRAFVCLMSKDAIHHPTVQRQNFANLTKDSPCDNVFLEHRLALELRDMGLIERVYPVMIGEVTDTGTYSKYSEFGSWASDVSVDVVENKLREHLDRQGLGAPMKAEASPRDVLSVIGQNQGFFIEGELSESLNNVSGVLVDMIRDLKEKDVAAVIATPESGIQSKSASVFISSDMERIIKEHDLMLNGLQNLSHVMSEHIKSLINIHHTTTATVSINTTTDKDKDKAVNDVPVKRNSGVFFGSKKIHPAATEPAAMNRQTNGNGNDSNNTTTNDSSLSTSLTSNGWGALLQAQNMVADLRALITGSGTSTSTGSRSQQFSGGDLGREIDSAAILLHGKELYEKSHDILSSGHHYMSLDSLSKTLLWRGEMKTLDGNISTETFYKVKLKQGMEIRIDDINSSLTLVISESIQMKVVIKEDIHRSDWLEALKNATCT